jgi:23S rRNA pseudouridine1911/1915/1917 synthase
MDHSEAPKTLSLPVPDSLAGKRLDQALAQMFPQYSRSRLKEWVL